jgi:hypothetical protein
MFRAMTLTRTREPIFEALLNEWDHQPGEPPLQASGNTPQPAAPDEPPQPASDDGQDDTEPESG